MEGMTLGEALQTPEVRQFIGRIAREEAGGGRLVESPEEQHRTRLLEAAAEARETGEPVDLSGSPGIAYLRRKGAWVDGAAA